MDIEELNSVLLSSLFGESKQASGDGVPCRRAAVDTNYAGKAITTTLDDYQTQFTYTDNASGESDSIKLDIFDPDARWRSAWAPRKGDKISSKIAVKDWLSVGDDRVLDCGSFTLDSVDFSGEPSMLNMGAVSAPLDDAFATTERSDTWEQTTVKQIAQKIADRYQMELCFDCEDVSIAKKEQSKQTDSDFLNKLCEDYGLCLKVFAGKIVIFSRPDYKEKDPVATIAIEDIFTNWKFDSDLAGNYTGVKIEYSQTSTIETTTKKGKATKKKKKEKVSFEYGTGPRWLKINEKVDDPADAERLAKGRLEKENHGKSRLSISTLGNPTLVASQCITVAGLGPTISGKYYIDSITHEIGGSGYVCSYKLALITTKTKEVVYDAVDRLAALGIINKPSYWKEHYKDVQYLDELLIDMAVRLKVNAVTEIVKDVDLALNTMKACGVINSPDYWRSNMNALAYLPELFLKAANSVKSEVIPVG